MKLCMIGCGAHAGSSHGPVQARLAAVDPGLRLAGCCDLDATRAEDYRRRFGFARAYTDITAMLAAEQPDAAVLVVPDARTAALGARVLETGVP
ncbi:MAG TPA: Gfo/Idh/MocA family oxidoreductase, partial [Vicinamibacteria bacterium]|nr:Gfo/Idh/MocA family oxidoreductase [Vicinamibacteria bacterium]